MDRIRLGHDHITFRVTSAQTDGALLAAEVELPAGGGPPALHRHAAAEVYRVDAGELALYVEDGSGAVRRHVAARGATVPIAGGRAHTVRNESGAVARAYVVFAPGAEMEAFVRAAADLAGDGAPAVDEVMALAARHGIEFTGPVPAAA